MALNPISRIEIQRRYIRRRAKDLLGRVEQMDDEELRWIVRLLADCLTPQQRAAHLGNYTEHWSLHQLRRFIRTFVPRYTTLALKDLRVKAAHRGTRLAGLTEEDLQSLSLGEKWDLLAKDPHGLRVDQLRRELARLFMCKSHELLHDTGLSQAVVEYPAYHRIREALEAMPDAAVADLTRRILEQANALLHGTAAEVEATLVKVREAVGQAAGVRIPVDQLFAGQMVKLPLEHPDRVPGLDPSDTVGGLAAESSEEEMANALLVLMDLMNLREWEEQLLPLQDRYGSPAAIPPEDLRQISGRMGDRRITDFADRYRSGRMLADRKVDPTVWELLPVQERLAMLERDNRAMDLAQTVKHLVKILFSFQYEMLFDSGFHTDLLRHPSYQQLVSRLVESIRLTAVSATEGRRWEELTQTVTRKMLELETVAPEARPGRLQEIRTVIATALGLAAELTYAAGREGRA
jgi:hypothetical protein